MIMKRIGILGGLGPEATLDYYREIINAFKSRDSSLNYPEIIIYSVNMSEFLLLMKNRDYEKLVTYMLRILDGLKNGGADFAAISANTPHLVFDSLQEKSDIPLISIVESTCKEALRLGLKRPGLFGTGFTMNATFYQEVFSRQGIEIILPGLQDRQMIDEKLFSEIELGIFKEETRRQLVDIIGNMVRLQRIDSLILGCTEFPLILTEKSYAGIPMLNTTKIHVEAIVDYCRENDRI
jgi:aspartate racemase